MRIQLFTFKRHSIDETTNDAGHASGHTFKSSFRTRCLLWLTLNKEHLCSLHPSQEEVCNQLVSSSFLLFFLCLFWRRMSRIIHSFFIKHLLASVNGVSRERNILSHRKYIASSANHCALMMLMHDNECVCVRAFLFRNFATEKGKDEVFALFFKWSVSRNMWKCKRESG